MTFLFDKNRCNYFFLLQTLNSISAEKNSTVIFPLPIDLIMNIIHGKKEAESKEKDV